MQHKISVLVIEDEEIWATKLQMSLDSLGFTVVGMYDNAEDALINIPSLEFDIALLDINLNGKNIGIELGKIIGGVYKKPFIFITGSFDNHTVEQAVSAKPSAYLTKPANDASLFIAVQNAIENFDKKETAHTISSNNNYDSFFVKLGNRYKKIEWNNVVALVSDKKYTKVLLCNESTEFFINNTLPKTQLHIIPAALKNQFVQINRAEVINIKFVEELGGDRVKTPIGIFESTDGYLKELKVALNIV